ncbi:hypothetical protein CHS0354_030873 [Potamilus streckersoni]|uniref:Mitochondria-eating protein C-terminal domain-containing protein n=1 Tax=Potamilus streckersoni TaxID=2493646 RepID=A0AAE0VZA1_9BIVA|nr:hypothetical protein CHS0354_030873 [Potamilus streckersoni]
MGLIYCCCRNSEKKTYAAKKEDSSDQSARFDDISHEGNLIPSDENQQDGSYKAADIAGNAVIQGRHSHYLPSDTEDKLHLVANDSMEREIASDLGMDQSQSLTSESATGGIYSEGSCNRSYGEKSNILPPTGSPVTFPDKRKDTLEAQASKLREELEFHRKTHEEERRKMEEDLQRNREKIKQLEEDRNELLNRISSQAAARMTHDNPNITDLSDQNRPTKISERYSELYDNQWTDAFENLQKNHHLEEATAIEVLLDVLSVSFDECKEVRRLKENLLKALKRYIGEDEDNEDVTILEVMRTLKSTKRNIKKMQDEFNQHVHSKLDTENNYKEILSEIRPYVDECVEICLLMNIQEPPLELRGLESSSSSAFDSSAFKPYTESGNKIEFIVWPAMYLYQNGPLLCKGVAQGMSDSSNVLKSMGTKHDEDENEFQIEVNVQQRDPKRDSNIDQVPNDKNVDNEEKQHKEKRKESHSSQDSRREISSHQLQNKTEKSITQDGQSDGSTHVDQTKQSTHSTLNLPTEKRVQEKVETPPKIKNKTVIIVTHL